MANPPALEASLQGAFSAKHISAALKHFEKQVREYQVSEWEEAIASGGKLVEAILKALYIKAGKIPPTGGKFKAGAIIDGLQNMPAGSVDDGIRVLLPRACRFAYDIARNRGSRHDSDEVDANEMDATAVIGATSWILAEMVRLAQPGKLAPKDAKALVDGLIKRRFPVVADVDGRVYFHKRQRSAPDVAVVVLWYRYPRRISRQDLVATVIRHGFKKKNAEVAIQRLVRSVDDDGTGQLRLLGPGLKQAEELVRSAG